MKWFWYSLIGFCLFMCSCKTQKLESGIQVREDVRSEISVMSESIKADTTKTVRIEQIESNKVMKETIIEEVYDKDSGVITKKTTTERTVAQDSNKVVAEKGENQVILKDDILVKHESDFTKTMDSEQKTESVGGQESFGKWLAISCVIAMILLYLRERFKQHYY